MVTEKKPSSMDPFIVLFASIAGFVVGLDSVSITLIFQSSTVDFEVLIIAIFLSRTARRFIGVPFTCPYGSKSRSRKF